ncbi:protease HtpX [Sansalvadorimonas verongulae]|uniref:protease HtpX n=1 Tax=Sansalvadorimonas verongulae TaxID=2172824 RepID=UPI0012BB66A7|nr:protease HtpX [Sansalvadorimonas verongulae]MTI12580.1 protease HtpX [Sansalvadorimonas verongulae]
MKRIALFLATNLAVVLVLGIVTNIVLPILGLNTRGMGGLLVFAMIFGFGGSFISLAISKWMALRSTGAQVIEQPRNSTQQWLLDTVARQAQAAGIGMPQVAMYDSPDINAFATGASKNNALVAVSTGLIRNMSQDEAEAVLGHEISHIANGDMVTLTLIQGVVNTFVIFIARAIAMFIDNFLRGDDEEGGLGMFAYMGVVFVLEAILGIGASIIVMWFSRQREFRADEGGAYLAGRGKMVAALRRLQQSHEPQLEGSMMAFGINGKRSMSEMFLSHPPLEKRIAHLQSL